MNLKAASASPRYLEPKGGQTRTADDGSWRASLKVEPPLKKAVLPAVAAPAHSPLGPEITGTGGISLTPLNKMAMPAVVGSEVTATQQQPKISMTSKEWIVPPRPKPGRKPATDTPPTKRKAQNRAAQRAFRERRAARVGELEELLEEHKTSQETKEKELNQRIRDLEMEVQSFRSRCLLLETMLERERRERIAAEMQADVSPRRQSGHAGLHYRTESSQPPPPRPRQLSISQIITPPQTTNAASPHHQDALAHDAPLSCGNCSPAGPCACAEEVLASVVSGCGRCDYDTSCACLDETIRLANQPAGLKRAASPSVRAPAPREKRVRPEAEPEFVPILPKQPAQPAPPSAALQLPSADSMAFRDSCGFCKDGTYCVCAEAAMATPAMTPTETAPVAARITRQTRTPPPSEHDLAMEMTADGAVKLPRRNPKTMHPAPRPACGPNGPGTCAQCQADPKSGLLCRLMAANMKRSQDGGQCCGGSGGGGGGCCKAQSRPPAKVTLPSLPSLGLSCAEAYQTLSSHSNFDRAADDIGSWVHRLKAAPTAQPARMPIEVEAASIMSVLKEFDIRFGREC